EPVRGPTANRVGTSVRSIGPSSSTAYSVAGSVEPGAGSGPTASCRPPVQPATAPMTRATVTGLTNRCHIGLILHYDGCRLHDRTVPSGLVKSRTHRLTGLYLALR